MINIDADFETAIGDLSRVQDQIDYAAFIAVDDVVKLAQEAERTNVQAAFKVRRSDYIRGSIKILQFPKKGSPVAIIGIDPTRNVLAKFEDGGQKTPRSSGIVGGLSVPMSGARPSPYDVVPPALKASSILNDQGFKVTSGGKQFVLLRTGPSQTKGSRAAGQRPRDPNVKVMYVVKAGVPIPPALRFVETIRSVVESRWVEIANAAIRKAIATAR